MKDTVLLQKGRKKEYSRKSTDLNAKLTVHFLNLQM